MIRLDRKYLKFLVTGGGGYSFVTSVLGGLLFLGWNVKEGEGGS